MLKIPAKITALSRKQAIGLLAFFALAVALILWPQKPVTFPQEILYIESGPRLWQITAEIAKTGGQQRQGLMHRKSLDENHGMLFIFPDEEDKAMWMKNTKIPLDMLFIDNAGTIVYMAYHAKPMSTNKISAARPVRAVLELPGGSARMYGLKPGDKILYSAFKNPPPVD